jgi:hypothetical protein
VNEARGIDEFATIENADRLSKTLEYIYEEPVTNTRCTKDGEKQL